jgi:hypothetical protein
VVFRGHSGDLGDLWMSSRRHGWSLEVILAPRVVFEGRPGTFRGHTVALGGLWRSFWRPGWSLEVILAPWVVSGGHSGALGGLWRSFWRPGWSLEVILAPRVVFEGRPGAFRGELKLIVPPMEMLTRRYLFLIFLSSFHSIEVKYRSFVLIHHRP